MSLFNSLFAKEKKTDANNGKEDVTQNLDLSGLKYFEKKEQLKHIKKLESIVNKINACEEVVLHQTAPFNIDEAEEYASNSFVRTPRRNRGEALQTVKTSSAVLFSLSYTISSITISTECSSHAA